MLLVLAALSAAVSMVTVSWLYPEAPLPTPLAPPRFTSEKLPPELIRRTDGEELPLELIRQAGAGDLAGAASLATPLTREALFQVSQLAPIPLRATELPSPAEGPHSFLVWARYLRDGKESQGAWLVNVESGKATGLTGPMAPFGGYGPLPWPPLDERARPVNPATYQGKGLVLISPRAPELKLIETMTQLHADFSPYGITVVLLQDMQSPDLSTTARRAGFSGPIWRLKGNVEDVPVVTQGRLLGAAGLLVDRGGKVVASLAALDPSRYGLGDRSVPEIAATVFRAYGLVH